MVTTNRTAMFSDEISGWAQEMNRSETELELERFFQEASSSSKPHRSPLDLSSSDSDEYRLFLKNKLALECVAYALTREPSTEHGDLLHLRTTQLGAHVQGQVAQNQAHCEPTGSSTLPDTQNKQAKQTTSESSREDSDDELERDTETTENKGPQDVKRARRMHSNRESARRSRKRKQALLSELEEQVEELRKNKNALLQRQDSCNRKYSDATVEHRILNAEIEALRAKVRMSEERVKQASGGYNPFLGMPLVTGPIDASRGAPLAMQTNPDQIFHLPIPNAAPLGQRFGGAIPSNNNVSFGANNQIGAGANPSQATAGWDLPQAHMNIKRQD